MCIHNFNLTNCLSVHLSFNQQILTTGAIYTKYHRKESLSHNPILCLLQYFETKSLCLPAVLSVLDTFQQGFYSESVRGDIHKPQSGANEHSLVLHSAQSNACWTGVDTNTASFYLLLLSRHFTMSQCIYNKPSSFVVSGFQNESTRSAIWWYPFKRHSRAFYAVAM